MCTESYQTSTLINDSDFLYLFQLRFQNNYEYPNHKTW